MRAPTIPDVIEIVQRNTGVDLPTMRSRTKRRTVVRAREDVVFLARRLCHASYADIAYAFGRISHTTTRDLHIRAMARIANHPADRARLELLLDLTRRHAAATPARENRRS